MSLRQALHDNYLLGEPGPRPKRPKQLKASPEAARELMALSWMRWSVPYFPKRKVRTHRV